MAGNASPAHLYRETAVNTANPLQLVVMLYDAAITSLQKARYHIEHKDIEGRSNALNHCISVISELQSCLNLKEGGEIAISLDRLYDYMKSRIIKANVDQSAKPLEEIEGILENICSAWRELVKKAPDGGRTEANRGIPRANLPGGDKHPNTELKSFNISI